MKLATIQMIKITNLCDINQEIFDILDDLYELKFEKYLDVYDNFKKILSLMNESVEIIEDFQSDITNTQNEILNYLNDYIESLANLSFVLKDILYKNIQTFTWVEFYFGTLFCLISVKDINMVMTKELLIREIRWDLLKEVRDSIGKFSLELSIP